MIQWIVITFFIFLFFISPIGFLLLLLIGSFLFLGVHLWLKVKYNGKKNNLKEANDEK